MRALFLTLLSLCFSLLSYAQNQEINDWNNQSLEVINSDPEKAAELAKMALQKSQKNNYKEGEAWAHYNLGNVAYYLDEYETGIEELDAAGKIFLNLKNQKGLGYVENTRGEILTLSGNYSEALNSLFKALEHFGNAGDDVGLARVNNNIGLIHYYQGNSEEALHYFKKALETADETRKGDASLYIGRTLVDQNKFQEAEEHLNLALEIGKKTEDKYITSDGLFLLGKTKAFFGEDDKALQLFSEAIQIKEEVEDNQGISLIENLKGNLYLRRNLPDSARIAFQHSLELSRAIGAKEELKNAALGLSNTYHHFKQFDSAYHYLSLHNQINQELLSEEASKKLAELEASLAAQKREAEIAAEREFQAFQKKVLLFSSLGLILVFLVISLMLLNRYRLKQKANQALEKLNHEILEQKDIIEEKNKDIMDSIQYAKRIQEAILPSEELLRKNLPEHFILYLPKDIVSGDFYWLHPSGNKVLFAAVDCTGHGVPGAFVSIVGYNGLNRSIKEFSLDQPAAILDKLTQLVEETFRMQGSTGIKDGMDISLCALEMNSQRLEWAGAHNPLWIIRKNGTFEEYKADKQPIGEFADRKDFTHHSFDLEKGDAIFIFSDGYADQFGGEKGKKFKYSQFRDLLIANHMLPMDQLKALLFSRFHEWKGDLEQIDDVCVIGIRI